MRSQKTKSLLFVGQCAVQLEDVSYLKNAKVAFFLPSSTVNLQPLDREQSGHSDIIAAVNLEEKYFYD
jgi:hypothetical protein